MASKEFEIGEKPGLGMKGDFGDDGKVVGVLLAPESGGCEAGA